MGGEKRDWRVLCEAVGKEKAPEKLISLIAELMKALDERKTGVKASSDAGLGR